MDPETFLFILFTGIGVIALSYALDRLWAAAMPVRIFYLFIRFPGIVLHECAHITGCVLTGARIRNVVLFSENGGSVTYTRPVLPYAGDVIISTAPLFLLPLALSLITGIFSAWLGCIFPVFPAQVSPDALRDLMNAIIGTFFQNLIVRFNGWFLLYLYLTTSIVLSIAPSMQDWKNAVAGSAVLVLAAVLVFWSGIPLAVSLLEALVRILGYGLALGIVYGLVALAASFPLVVWYLFRRCS